MAHSSDIALDKSTPHAGRARRGSAAFGGHLSAPARRPSGCCDGAWPSAAISPVG